MIQSRLRSPLKKLYSRFRNFSSGSNQFVDDFATLVVDRLEQRRVLSVTAVLSDGVLSITGDDAVEESVTLTLLNSGADGQSVNEFIRILDGDGNIVPIDTPGGSLFVPLRTSSIFDPLTMTAGRIDIQLGSGQDHVHLQIPTGASFDLATQGALTINVLGGDDTVVLFDNGTNPVAQNVDLNLSVATLQFGDDDFRLGSAAVQVDGTVQLTTSQSVTTQGSLEITGSIFAEGPGNPDLIIDTGGDHFLISDSIGSEAHLLGNLTIDSSEISLGSSVHTLGDQDYLGDLTLSDDLFLTSHGSGSISFDEIHGNGFALEVSTAGQTHFRDDVDSLSSLTTDSAGETLISASSIETDGTIEFGDPVVLSQDVLISAPESVLFASSVDSQAGEFHSLQIESLSAGGIGSLDGNVLLEGPVGMAPDGDLGALVIHATHLISLHDVQTSADQGALSSGAQTYHAAEIITDGNFNTHGGNFTLTGNWDLQSSARVSTSGGAINLANAIASTSNLTETIRLELDSSGTADGMIDLGRFDDSSGRPIDDLIIQAAGDVVFHSSLELLGSLSQLTGSEITRFIGTGQNELGGTLDLTTDQVHIEAGQFLVHGGISLDVQNELILGDNVLINADQSDIALNVNQDGLGEEGFFQAESSRLKTTSETVSAIELDVAGSGQAVIASFQVGETSGRISIHAGGGIVDGTPTDDLANLTAFAAVLSSTMSGQPNSGIGATEDFDTAVSQLAFRSESGITQIVNTGALEITAVGSVTVSTAVGGGFVSASSPLTISAPIIVGQDFSFIAGNSPQPGDTLTIAADVTHLDGNGVMSFIAGDDIVLEAGAIQNRGGNVNELRFVANNEGNLDLDFGGITQTGGRIDAERVAFHSHQTVSVQSSLNDFDVLAAGVSQFSHGFFQRDVDGFVIGTVDSLQGIRTFHGDVGIVADGHVTIGTGNGEGIDTSGAIVRFAVNGGVSEATGSVINTHFLKIRGIGPFQLDQANAVDILTVNVNGPLEYRDVDGFTIGNLESAFGVTTVNDDITLISGGQIILGTGAGQPLRAPGATIRIEAVDGMVESAGSVIESSSLKLTGTGTFLLDQQNDVDTVTAMVGGEFVFQDRDDLTIGSVDNMSGITSLSGNVTVSAHDDLNLSSESFVVSGGDRVLLVGGDALDPSSASAGGLFMEDGSFVTADGARIDLIAGGDLQIGQVQTSMDVRSTSLLGSIIDAGDVGGFDVQASNLGIDAATGVGNGNPLEVSVNNLAVGNSVSGEIRIDNADRPLLTIGQFGDPLFDSELGFLIGVVNDGMGLGSIDISNAGAILIDQPVINLSGGALALRAVAPTSGTDHLTINALVFANDPGGHITLETGGNLILNDTGALLDVQGTSVSGIAGGDVNFADNVIVASSTGSITNPVPLLDNVMTPQVTAGGISVIQGGFGRVNDNTFVFQILWDPEGPVQDTYLSGEPIFSDEFQTIVGVTPGVGPGSFSFDHQYFGNPNEMSPASPIPIQITLFDDPNILFVSRGEELGKVSTTSLAPVPGEGLFGSIPFDLSIEIPQLEPPRTQVSTAYVEVSESYNETDEETSVDPVVDVESVRNERIVLIQKINSEGEVELDRFGRPIQSTLFGKEAEAILSDLPDLFDRLSDGRWKIYLKEGEDAQLQLVEDVQLRDGRPASGGDDGTQDRPPTEDTEFPAPQQKDSSNDPEQINFRPPLKASEELSQSLREFHLDPSALSSPAYEKSVSQGEPTPFDLSVLATPLLLFTTHAASSSLNRLRKLSKKVARVFRLI